MRSTARTRFRIHRCFSAQAGDPPHRRRKKPVAVAAGALGGVHRRVGVPTIRRASCVARTDVMPMLQRSRLRRPRARKAAQVARIGGDSVDMLRRVTSVRSTVNSSPPRRATVSVSRTQALMRWATSCSIVAGLVPNLVVDLLEPVEVDEQQRQRQAGTRRMLDFVLEPFAKQAAVRQVGEEVVVALRQMRSSSSLRTVISRALPAIASQRPAGLKTGTSRYS